MNKLLRQFSSEEFEALIESMKGGNIFQNLEESIDTSKFLIDDMPKYSMDRIVVNFELIYDQLVGSNKILKNYIDAKSRTSKEDSMEEKAFTTRPTSIKDKLDKFRQVASRIKSAIGKLTQEDSSGILGAVGGLAGGAARLGGFARVAAPVAAVAAVGAAGYAGYSYFSRGGEPDVSLSPNREVLDNIAMAEGTYKSGYNTSLGYGRYLPGGREHNLTSMTLEQILELGYYMRRQPGNPNSSAMGRYQITGSTLKEAAKALGYDLKTTRFSPDVQDRMAMWILKNQGFGAWEGFKRNPENLRSAKEALKRGAQPYEGPSVRRAPLDMSSLQGIYSSIAPGMTRIGDGFGARGGKHDGIDIPGKAGSPIRVVEKGTVIFAGTMGGYGNRVEVDHGAGKVTTYSHLASIGVRKGQPVERGTVIGTLGSTGRSTGPHLHFEVKINGSYVDPNVGLKQFQPAPPKKPQVQPIVIVKGADGKPKVEFRSPLAPVRPPAKKKAENFSVAPSLQEFYRLMGR